MSIGNQGRFRGSADGVREFILNGIADGIFKLGDKLPTERELSSRFGAARSAIRRILANLEAEGRIVRSVGRGTFVAPPRPPSNAGNDTHVDLMDTSPAELIEARLLFEPKLAELVVTNATAADFARIESCLNNGEAAATLEEFEVFDAALHQAIAAATHNSFVIGVFNMINSVRQQAEWGKLKQRSITLERRSEYERDHRQIVAALRERDAVRASASIVAHLRHVRKHLLGY